MDLSGVIFALLAVAWVGYLIPRALRHHEEIAASRPVDSFSDTMRVLERTPATMKALLTPPPTKPAAKRGKAVEETPLRTRVEPSAKPGRPTSCSAARGAARRRRRVLSLLLLATAATAGVAGFHYLPWVSVAVPGLLVLGWLVLCRLMVRKTRVVRRTSAVIGATDEVAEVVPVEAPVAPPVVDPVAALEDDGSLWDPLPLTLPTYVSKPAARRTVRTIDLTQTGVTSSGHKAEDTQLARAAEATSTAEAESGEGQQRKAAGA